MPGRPTTPAELIRIRRSAWERAVRYSGLKQSEIAEVIGASVSTVASYGSKAGNTPSQEAIARLKQYSLDKALETLAERYGGEAVRRIGGQP
jgi:hypothetical protein